MPPETRSVCRAVFSSRLIRLVLSVCAAVCLFYSLSLYLSFLYFSFYLYLCVLFFTLTNVPCGWSHACASRITDTDFRQYEKAPWTIVKNLCVRNQRRQERQQVKMDPDPNKRIVLTEHGSRSLFLNFFL